MDFRYRRSKLTTLTALLKEAGEALDDDFSYPTDMTENCLYCSGNYNITPPSEHHEDCEWLQKKNHRAEIRKKIQEVMG